MSLGVPPICACPEGPYIGTQRFGAPVCCERCGRLTREQFDAIAGAHPLDADGHCEWWHAAMERFAEAAEARTDAAGMQAQVERMRPYAEHGSDAFLQDWRDRCERAEAKVAELEARWEGRRPISASEVCIIQDAMTLHEGLQALSDEWDRRSSHLAASWPLAARELRARMTP